MKYIMSKEALGKMALIKGAIEGRYTVMETARRLNITARRVKQLKKAYRERGEEAFVHGNSGRHPANYTDEKLRAKIIALKNSEKYSGTNFTHFNELIFEREGIKTGYGALCGILKGAGIKSKKGRRSEGRRYKKRARRSAFGEMLQADASSYDWFGTGGRCALHGFIDDATGKITGLYFCKNECLMGYLEVLRQTLQKHGVPLEIYADKAGIFLVNNKKEENWTVEETLAGRALDKTQFGVIVQDRLGINMISAHTPQAKGRIERLWGTLQDRLTELFKLDGITDMDEANRRIQHYIDGFNRRFAVEPQKKESAFVPLCGTDDLDKLLAVRHERVTDNCGCFSFQNFAFQIESGKPIVKKKITFLFSQKIGLTALHGKNYFPVSCLGLNKNKTVTHMPDVIKILVQKYYLNDRKLLAA